MVIDEVKAVLRDMRPDGSHSIEVRKVHQIGDSQSPTCLIIAEVTNDCGFSDYPRGRLVLLSGSIHSNISMGNGRMFVRVKSIIGFTKRTDWMRVIHTDDEDIV